MIKKYSTLAGKKDILPWSQKEVQNERKQNMKDMIREEVDREFPDKTPKGRFQVVYRSANYSNHTDAYIGDSVKVLFASDDKEKAEEFMNRPDIQNKYPVYEGESDLYVHDTNPSPEKVEDSGSEDFPF
jgi:hypothetical protein